MEPILKGGQNRKHFLEYWEQLPEPQNMFFLNIVTYHFCIKWVILVFLVPSPAKISIFWWRWSSCRPRSCVIIPWGVSLFHGVQPMFLQGTAPELQQRVGDTQMVVIDRAAGVFLLLVGPLGEVR